MATPFKYTTGNYIILASAELNSLANGASALGSGFDNGPSASGYYWAEFELVFQSGPNNPNSGSALNLFLIRAITGTTYQDTGVNVSPNMFVGAFVVSSGTAQRVGGPPGVPLPPVAFKPLLVNNCGQALSASASQLAMLPYTQSI